MRRCSGCGRRTSARSGTTAASRRPGRSATTTSSRTTPRPSTSTGCTAGTARTRPRARPARRTRYPPVEHEPRIQQLSDDLEKQGLHPFHLPIGVDLTQDEDGRATRTSACIRCDRVDGFPCLVGAKSDAQVICVDPALEHENVELVTNAHVQRLETDPTGRTVTGVVTSVEATAAPSPSAADVVVVVRAAR